MLEVKGLRAGYGRIQALHGIDLAVARGELVALVGANGAGKTTLLKALSGIQGFSGSVAFEGEEIQHRAGFAGVHDGGVRSVSQRPDVVVFERANRDDIDHGTAFLRAERSAEV